MSSPSHIRVLKREDLKTVRFFIGAASMIPLAVANSKASRHPLTIAIWLGLSAVMIGLTKWWPTTTGPGGLLGVLAPLPALGAVAVPIMFFFDWLHRPVFEKELQNALGAPDMKEPQVHYTRSPASGFYILEHNSKPIGLIALDASPVSSNSHSSDNNSKKKKKPGISAETAVIRHFYVEDVYRAAGVQTDLLEHALSHAFAATSESSPLPKRVLVVASALEAYKLPAFRKAGFRPASDIDDFGPQEWKVGVFNWKCQRLEITRERWRSERQ